MNLIIKKLCRTRLFLCLSLSIQRIKEIKKGETNFGKPTQNRRRRNPSLHFSRNLFDSWIGISVCFPENEFLILRDSFIYLIFVEKWVLIEENGFRFLEWSSRIGFKEVPARFLVAIWWVEKIVIFVLC